MVLTIGRVIEVCSLIHIENTSLMLRSSQKSYFDLSKSRIITNVGEFEIVDIRVLFGCLIKPNVQYFSITYSLHA